MAIGYDHMELVGDLDKSSNSGVEAHLEKSEESGEVKGFVHLTMYHEACPKEYGL